MITETHGDLVENFKAGKYDACAHGCNCFYAMNSGIAKTIREEFVEAYKADLLSVYGSNYKLGLMTYAQVDYGTIYNLYTQYQPGNQTDVEQLYKNIRGAFRNLNFFIKEFKKREKLQMYKVAVPLIGAGIAGGDWDVIKTILHEEVKDFDLEIVNFVPGAVNMFEQFEK